jgi:DNA invertase Pin-like site-specific DNA recombinase
MKPFFGYIRVSTARQGEHGVSLPQQRDAIMRHAAKNNLDIVRWFEERETAAKRGRPVFNEMLKLLRLRKADGVIIHKIDRSARNLKDWADLGELIDENVDVQFANESLDMRSRGGRLTADIQAVVAADYIRNLREEARKGFYGRLKQGFYPLPAPLGYLDRGRAKAKEIDPVNGPLVRQTFELYATGRFSLETLREEIAARGLRTRGGNPLSVSTLSDLLNNPFYFGLIRLRSTGESFEGKHEPIITKSLFDRVGRTLLGKFHAKVQFHDYLFRRILRCGVCAHTLTGERQKGHVYYRCHSEKCKGACVREETVQGGISNFLKSVSIGNREVAYLSECLSSQRNDLIKAQETAVQAARLALDLLKSRFIRLTDAYLDGSIEKETFEERKASLLADRKGMEQKITEMKDNDESIGRDIAEVFELVQDPEVQYEMASPEEKREMLLLMTSNRVGHGRNVEFTLVPALQTLAKGREVLNSAPDRIRTCYRIEAEGDIGIIRPCFCRHTINSNRETWENRTIAMGIFDTSGRFVILVLSVTPDYGGGKNAPYQRRHRRISLDLERGIYRRDLARRSDALRFATFGTLRPARPASPVREAVCTA